MKDNKPIPIDCITDAPKMRGFRPESAVTNALKRSTLLDMLENKPGGTASAYVRRKVPMVYTEEMHDSLAKEQKTKAAMAKRKARAKKAESKDAAADGEPEEENRLPKQGVPGGKGIDKPTGFEEYWTDPPVTPEVFEEEKTLYNPGSDFALRIETAVARFKAGRKFHSEMKNIFDKWMRFGGVNTEPKQFTGLDKKDLEGLSKQEKIDVTVTVVVDEDKYFLDTRPDAGWAVDFEGVAKAFLSDHLSYIPSVDEGTGKRATTMMRNFYNYILHHNVCPEYTKDVMAARAVCDRAERELLLVQTARDALPSRFNTACATLFNHTGVKAHTDVWSAFHTNTAPDMDDREALQIFTTGVAALVDDPAAFEKVRKWTKESGPSPQLVRSETVGFEIVDIIRTEGYARESLYEQFGKPVLSTVIVKLWNPGSLDEYDLPASALSHSNNPSSLPPDNPPFTLFLEEDILRSLLPGMKIEAAVRTLDIGLRYFEAVDAVRPSFYCSLLNEMAMHWKPLKWNDEDAMKKMERDDARLL